MLCTHSISIDTKLLEILVNLLLFNKLSALSLKVALLKILLNKTINNNK